MTSLSKLGWALVLAAAPVLGCNRPDEGALRTDAGSRTVTAALGFDAAISSRDAAVDGGEAASEPAPPVGDGGAWFPSDIYDLKVDAVKLCKPPEKADGSAFGVLVGAKVQLKAKTSELFVDVRHATLRQGGVLFPAKVDQTFPGCTPGFKAASLQRGQVDSGFLVFELPARATNLVLEFHPQRWGGAGTARINIDLPL